MSNSSINFHMSRTHTPLSCGIKISLRTFTVHQNTGHGRDHISTFPTLSRSLPSSIDQFDDLQGKISEEIERRRENTMEINDPK